MDPSTRAILPSIVVNAAYAFEDLDTCRGVALGEKPGDIYSRNSNPTTRRLEEKVAALEGARSATSFATGMAAISTVLFALLNPSQRAVTVRDAYGATYLHFTQILPRFGIVCEVCETDDHQAIQAAIRDGCDVLYLESPTNPTLKVLDLARLIQAAHQAGAIAIVDNTFATPINQNPIDLGADLPHNNALIDPPRLFFNGSWNDNPNPTTAFRHQGNVQAAHVDGHVDRYVEESQWLTSRRFHIGSVGGDNEPHYIPGWRDWPSP